MLGLLSLLIACVNQTSTNWRTKLTEVMDTKKLPPFRLYMTKGVCPCRSHSHHTIGFLTLKKNVNHVK